MTSWPFQAVTWSLDVDFARPFTEALTICGRYGAVKRLGLAWLLLATRCGGSDPNRTVFDPTGGIAPVDVTASAELEHPYPPLDSPDVPGNSGWIGVSVLRDTVRFARPRQWTIRDASLEPRHSFIRYVSPHAFSFAIYERKDGAGEAWGDILKRYEGDVAASGAKILGQHIATATLANQARGYTIERRIDAKPPVVSHSRELLVRGEHRVVLLQIVTDEESFSRIAGELVELMSRLEVL
jgi:hypothetical protein